jgi:hypothetical protein
MTSGDALRPGRLMWGGVQLQVEVTLLGITCRCNNLVNKVLSTPHGCCCEKCLLFEQFCFDSAVLFHKANVCRTANNSICMLEVNLAFLS